MTYVQVIAGFLLLFGGAELLVRGAVAVILGGLLSAGCAQHACCGDPVVEIADQPNVHVVEEFHADGALRLRKEVIRSTDGERVDHGAYVRWYSDGQKEYEAILKLRNWLGF